MEFTKLNQGNLRILEKHNRLVVKQTSKGCFQKCIGCDSAAELIFYDPDAVGIGVGVSGIEIPLYYGLEQSNPFIRVCCPQCHAFDLPMSEGSAPGGPLLATFSRYWKNRYFFVLLQVILALLLILLLLLTN